MKQGARFRPGPYSQLAAVYRRRGDAVAARKVLIERERLRTAGLEGWRQPLHWAWGKISAYGYQSWRAILGLVALIAVGWVVFGIADMAELGDPPHVVFVPPLYTADLAIPLGPR